MALKIIRHVFTMINLTAFVVGFTAVCVPYWKRSVTNVTVSCPTVKRETISGIWKQEDDYKLVRENTTEEYEDGWTDVGGSSEKAVGGLMIAGLVLVLVYLIFAVVEQCTCSSPCCANEGHKNDENNRIFFAWTCIRVVAGVFIVIAVIIFRAAVRKEEELLWGFWMALLSGMAALITGAIDLICWCRKNSKCPDCKSEEQIHKT